MVSWCHWVSFISYSIHQSSQKISTKASKAHQYGFKVLCLQGCWKNLLKVVTKLCVGCFSQTSCSNIICSCWLELFLNSNRTLFFFFLYYYDYYWIRRIHASDGSSRKFSRNIVRATPKKMFGCARRIAWYKYHNFSI